MVGKFTKTLWNLLLFAATDGDPNEYILMKLMKF